MAISPETIETIRERSDIVEVIGNYVALRKSGRNHVGLCPFHHEKSPSFSVSAEKKLYHCFGCHVGGDVFDFVMRHGSHDFQNAARMLASKVGIEVEPESPEVRQRRVLEESIAAANAAALAYFTQNLWSPHGATAQRYLGGRGIPAAFAKERRLGFGHTSEGLVQALLAQDHKQEAIAAAGLLSDEGRSLFAGRLIFPIHDLTGRVVGFGGRRLPVRGKDEAAGGPKYINTRDSALFKKSSLLYGLYDAQATIRRSKRLVLVEGYTDVLAAHRAGITDAVAALGTAFTPDHANLVKRLADAALVLLDADASGQRAARAASIVLLRAGLKTAVVPLPPGDDPDSLVQKSGARALQQAVNGAKPAVEYFMEAAFAKASMGIEDRAEAARELQPLLAGLPSGLERDLYTSRLAEKVGVPVEQLLRHFRDKSPPATAARPPPERGPAPAPKQQAPPSDDSPPPGWEDAAGPAAAGPTKAAVPLPFELELLRELMLFPNLRARFGELAEYAVSPQLHDLLEDLAQAPEPAADIINRHLPDSWCARLSRVKPFEHEMLDEVNSKSNRTFEDVLASLKRRHIESAMQSVLRDLRDAEARGEATDTLLRRKQELAARKRALKTAAKPAGLSK